jgi:exodeoxyribonuclease V alpha subunit
VGMTRGRRSNTAHLIAENLGEAREQWIAVFARDRADLGPAHAAELAAREAARYAEPRPTGKVSASLRHEREALPEASGAWPVTATMTAARSGGVRRPEPAIHRAPHHDAPRIRR